MARRLAAARRMADMDRLMRIEAIGQRRRFGGVSLHAVAPIDLCGPTMPATVVRDYAASVQISAKPSRPSAHARSAGQVANLRSGS
jgi:hypothetical protein